MPITVKGESHMYIHEMDYGRRRRLVEILDAHDTWKELGQRFIPPYPSEKIEKFARAVYLPGGSPADALLADWGKGNRTVVELFKHLAHMKHYQAMESLRDCIPDRYHKFIPGSHSRRMSDTALLHTSALSTMQLPRPGDPLSADRAGSHPDYGFDTSSHDTGLPSYRSRSNIQIGAQKHNRILPPKKYNQVRDKTVLNNLDSIQRNKEPPEAEKYPKKHIQMGALHLEGFSYNSHLPPDSSTQGDLARQLSHQQGNLKNYLPPEAANRGMAQPMQEQQGQLDRGLLRDQQLLDVNKSRHRSQPSTNLGRSLSQGVNTTVADSTFKKRILEEGKVPNPNPDIMLKNLDVRELAKACNNFHISNQIGKGGFGVVYRGRWNGQDIAVKRIKDERKNPGDKKLFKRYVNQAINELISLHTFPALNILQLLAYSYNYDESVDTDFMSVDLVYMHMVNGSVADRLRRRGGTEPLTWEQRANIALGTARGLVHLHAHKIIHGDIKSGNILLDQYFEPKIGDFGLARGGPESDSVSYLLASSLQGTMSYLPDDYVRSRQLTEQVDTFCYGMLLFELVSGKSPSWQDPDCARPDLRGYCSCQQHSTWREITMAASSLKSHPKLIDKMVGSKIQSDDDANSINDWAECLFRFGKDCTKRRRKERPPMEKIFAAIERVHQSPECQQWMARLPVGDEADLLVSSFEEFQKGLPPDVSIGGANQDVAVQHTSELPLPSYRMAGEPAQNPVFLQHVNSLHLQPSAPFQPNPTHYAPIPTILNDSLPHEGYISEENAAVLSEIPEDTTAVSTDSDETNEESGMISACLGAAKPIESYNEGIPKLLNIMEDGPMRPAGVYTNVGQYNLPNIQDLSMRDEEKEFNVYKNTQTQSQALNPIVHQPSDNRSIPPGIPRLPDLCWGSDQGELDPLSRLHKVESGVSDTSKQDLMASLPSKN